MKTMKKTMLTKTVGYIGEDNGSRLSVSKVIVTARFTSDAVGETLSLETCGIQITVPFEPVKELIDETRKSSK